MPTCGHEQTPYTPLPALRLGAHRVDLVGALIDGHHRRLEDDDAAPRHIHQRVGDAEVDGHVWPTRSAEPT